VSADSVRALLWHYLLIDGGGGGGGGGGGDISINHRRGSTLRELPRSTTADSQFRIRAGRTEGHRTPGGR